MENEVNAKIILLDEVKAMIKNQILEVEHSPIGITICGCLTGKWECRSSYAV